VVRDQLQDGRSHGVALLVGRNMDRGDAGGWLLPALCRHRAYGAASYAFGVHQLRLLHIPAAAMQRRVQSLTLPSTLRRAGRLPEEALDLCEVEPLRQEDPGSAVWVPDELQVSFPV
jgi:hypothetical protein